MRIVILDNYDSFVYNLSQMLAEEGAETIVVRNDAIDISGIRRLQPDGLVISPGPGTPLKREDFGVCREAIVELSPKLPTLGVCLGHQGIAFSFGGKIGRAPIPVHGKCSQIEHDGSGLFEGLPQHFLAGRYHSLMVTEAPACMKVSATCDGLIMGLRHERYPIEGVQFHPESVLTPEGRTILRNFLRQARR
jgi:anthranilate synthase component 2